MRTPIHILLAEDYPIVRQGMRSLLSAIPGYVVVGETGDGAEVVELVRKLDPDLLLLDMSLPNCCGQEILGALSAGKARAKVLAMSTQKEEEQVLTALHCGAAGYLLKSISREEIQVAIHAVIRGYRYLSTELADRAIRQYEKRGVAAVVRAAEQPSSTAAPLNKKAISELTNRQREVLRLLALGHGNAQIGNILNISPRTVEIHRANVMHKLGLTSSSALVRYALTHGLILIDD